MDFQRSDKVFTSRLFQYGMRSLLLYIFSMIFKSFDHTFFPQMQMIDMRGNTFSLCYVLYGLLVWEGAIFLSARVEKHSRHRRKLVVLCAILLLYGAFVSWGFGLVYSLFDIIFFHRYEAWEAFAGFSYDLIFGTFLFYMMILTFNGIVFYYNSWKEYQLQAERLMRENIQAKYDALRNQIDPHFFFNSLSVLTNLVYKSPDVSADYITQLAKTYRYILDKKFENLVPVQTELDFLESYLFLIRIRHRDSIRFIDGIPERLRSKGMIPPATLQLLVENAIKHNRFSSNDPLHIHVTSEGDHLVVSNPVKPRGYMDSALGIGLENIRKRYELAMGRSIEVYSGSEQFIVKIPVMPAS